VSLRSAATPVAVCSFCKSTLAREGDALRRMGQQAELFDDHSPLQLGTTGRYTFSPSGASQRGGRFGLVGRVQWRAVNGTWNEWVALFDDGSQAWLSEDNGRYVMAFEKATPPEVPEGRDARPTMAKWSVGQALGLDGRLWQVASIVEATVAAAEGELPGVPRSGETLTVVDLRNAQGEVGTLAAGERDVSWSIGQGVALQDLALQGLRDDASSKTATTRGAECPSCGAGLSITLESTKSITCAACKAVVDLSQGVGGELSFYKQRALPAKRAMLELGALGKLSLGGANNAPTETWQVVGYTVRQPLHAPGEEAESPWSEYLLYSKGVGFAFLVDAEDGWSWMVPLTGAPAAGTPSALSWQGKTYHRSYTYTSEVVFVEGEFYWPLKAGEHTQHADYVNTSHRLSREATQDEVTWSQGGLMQASTLRRAFGVPENRAGAESFSDTTPLTSSSRSWLFKVAMLIIVLMIISVLLSTCTRRDRCEALKNQYGAQSVEYRQCLNRSSGGARVGRGSSGGSWGGHK
jgi:hypothetical protein